MHSGCSARIVRVSFDKQSPHLFLPGCIPAEEMRFVLNNMPLLVREEEVDKMIATVDRNGDGKISYSEFRWV